MKIYICFILVSMSVCYAKVNNRNRRKAEVSSSLKLEDDLIRVKRKPDPEPELTRTKRVMEPAVENFEEELRRIKRTKRSISHRRGNVLRRKHSPKSLKQVLHRMKRAERILHRMKRLNQLGLDLTRLKRGRRSVPYDKMYAKLKDMKRRNRRKSLHTALRKRENIPAGYQRHQNYNHVLAMKRRKRQHSIRPLPLNNHNHERLKSHKHSKELVHGLSHQKGSAKSNKHPTNHALKGKPASTRHHVQRHDVH